MLSYVKVLRNRFWRMPKQSVQLVCLMLKSYSACWSSHRANWC